MFSLLELVTALRRNGYEEAANRIVDGEDPMDAMEHIFNQNPYYDDDEAWALQDFIDGLANGTTEVRGLV